MDLNVSVDREQWTPFLNVINSLCIAGENMEYFTMNPERIFSSNYSCKQIFTQYGIEDAESLTNFLAWVKDDSCGEEYEEIRSRLSLMSQEERSAFLRLTKLAPEKMHRMHVVNDSIMQMPLSGIKGYYYGLSIFYAYIGETLKYIDEKDKWDHISLVLQKILASYSSWREYIHAFHVGLLYHSSTLTRDISIYNKNMMIKLLTSPRSPILKTGVWGS